MSEINQTENLTEVIENIETSAPDEIVEENTNVEGAETIGEAHEISDQNPVKKTKKQRKKKQFNLDEHKNLKAIVEFLKSIRYAIIPFIIVLIFQQLSWTGNMMLGKDGVALTIPLDNKIPLVSEFIFIYLLTFPLAIFGFLWIASKDKKHFFNVWLTAIISFAISGIIYFFFQTQMTKLDFVATSFADKLMVWTWGACKPINCFPSQHVTMATSLILDYHNQQKTTPAWLRWTNYICAILIMMATVFLKQHFVVDIIGSLAIMIPTYIIVKTWNFGGHMEKKLERKTAKKLYK